MVDALSLVPWTHYEEWVADLGMAGFWPEVAKTMPNDNLRASLLLGMSCARARGGPPVDVDQMLLCSLFVAERGMFEFFDVGAGLGERWFFSAMAHANRGVGSMRGLHHHRRGCDIDWRRSGARLSLLVQPHVR